MRCPLNNFPCLNCGHPHSWHERLIHHPHVDCCVGCANVIGLNEEEAKTYHNYIPDNLLYLEQLSESGD
jgi:hypothetical protein